MRFGWIGLGDIGAPMAMRVHQGGLPLTVWNRTASRMQPFSDAGVTTAGSAAEVAEAVDVVLLCIDSPAGLEAALFGPDSVGDSTAPPQLVVDTSTMHPQVSTDIAARLAGSGIAFLDAPVSGGPQGAAAGTLSVFVGGDEEHLALARPALETFGGRITHLGPLGSGQVGKACNQVINFATMAAIAEATSLGEAFGLDVDLLVRAITGGLADSAMLREYIRASDAGESSGITAIVNGLRSLYVESSAHPAAGRVDILLKDLGAALDVARRHGSAAPVSGVLEGVYRVLLHQQAGS